MHMMYMYVRPQSVDSLVLFTIKSIRNRILLGHSPSVKNIKFHLTNLGKPVILG
jgi:hypothetical protein